MAYGYRPYDDADDDAASGGNGIIAAEKLRDGHIFV